MHQVFETEVGIKGSSLEFINTNGKFIELKDTYNPDMLISVVHDSEGNISSLALITTDKLQELCLIDKFTAKKTKSDQRKASQMLKNFKEGLFVNVPEMLLSIWDGVKPIAIEAATA